MTIATQLYEKAFNNLRDPRSEAYRAGVIDTLNFKETGQELKHPFEPGSAESDAWIAGNREGLVLWREHQDEEPAMNNPNPTTMEHYDNVTLARTMLTKCAALFIAIQDKAREADQFDTFEYRQV